MVSRFASWTLVSALLALPSPALSQSALLHDLHTGLAPLPGPIQDPNAAYSLFFPDEFVSFGGQVFFQSSSPMWGRELWRTDGTPEGTRPVLDLWPGPEGSEPRGLLDFQGTLLFQARTVFGRELWRTDGTPEGTVRLLRCPEGWRLDSPARLGTTLFFSGPDGELWKTDGTPQGTGKLKTIGTQERGASAPSQMVAVGGTVFFQAFHSSQGELWKSNGTEAGTVLVQKFPNSKMQLLGGLGGVALFVVRQSGVWGLWRSDVTGSGAVKVKDVSASIDTPDSWRAQLAGGRLFLATSQALWVSDGTASGTRLLKSLTHEPELVDLGGTLLFNQGDALWRSDGTEAGTVKVKDLPVSNSFGRLRVAGGVAYFTAQDSEFRPALWRTDGTEAGTVPVESWGGVSPSLLQGAGGRLFFGLGSSGQPHQLWVSEGTRESTRQLTSTWPEPQSSRPGDWVASDGLTLFSTHDDTLGPSLWKTDGTRAGTAFLNALRPGPTSPARPAARVASARQGDTFFLYSGEALWRSDGTGAGTQALAHFRAAPSIPELVRVGDTLYFPATGLFTEESTPSKGLELWKSDGTSPGTGLVKELVEGEVSSLPRSLRELNGGLYFVANSQGGGAGAKLWRSDGTPGGTLLVKDLEPDGYAFVSSPLYRVDRTLYFHASGPLWKSDGTEAGTVQVSLPLNSSLHTLYPVQGDEALYLQVSTGTGLFELRRLDASTPSPVKVWVAPKDSYFPVRGGFARARGGVVFMVWDAEHGLEPWRTDGTPEGTSLLKDVWPGPDSGIRQEQAPEVFVLEDQGLVLFAASDGESGEELWQTDGTPEGTLRVADVWPGPGSSVPRELSRLGNTLLFSAVDEAAGIEPHALPVPVWTDRSPPFLTCPADVSAQAPESSGGAVSYPPATASDLSGEPTVQYSHASGSRFPVGTTQVTVTATDPLGLSRQCTFAVNVLAEEPEKGPFGCACGTSGAGPLALWSLLALLAGWSFKARAGGAAATR